MAHHERSQLLSSRLEALMKQIGSVESFAILADLFQDAAVFVVDHKREVVLWSRGAEQLLGFPAEEVLGAHCLKSNRCATCMVGCGIEKMGEVRDVPLILYRADGQPVAVKKRARAFFDDDNKFIGGIEVLVPDSQGISPPVPALPPNTVTFRGMLSRSSAMFRVFDLVRNIAATDVTVLIRGESGTGKELVARALHEESKRSKGPFIGVSCAAFPPTLLESELFGHVKGAFTGAVAKRDGLFAQADGGTLFLDEVAELPLEIQAKLLRVLQERSFVPVGGTRARKVDVRIVSATHRSLRQLVKEGKFREDLLYRLRVVPLVLPPLKDRREDIEALAWHFIARRNEQGARAIHNIDTQAMRALLGHAWPGNVRELQNVVDYAFAVGKGEVLAQEDLPPEVQSPGRVDTPQQSPAAPPPLVTSASLRLPPEPERIKRALEESKGHNGKAAVLLGMSRVTLWRKRKKYDI